MAGIVAGIIIGALVGALLGGSGAVIGMFAGGLIGALFNRTAALQERLQALEGQVKRRDQAARAKPDSSPLPTQTAATAAPVDRPTTPAQTVAPPATAPVTATTPPPIPAPRVETVRSAPISDPTGTSAPAQASAARAVAASVAAARETTAAAAKPAPAAAAVPPLPPAEPDRLTLALRWLRRWFTEGNVPVKIGMLVLFAGVAALLRYVAGQGWLTVPIELRLIGVALAALVGLGFGWRQRERRRMFGLALQGGSIGILLLVVYAAFRFYGLLSAGPAFALFVALVALLSVLAVRQNALSLVLLGIVGGYLAPLLINTGRGNHVVLFGYYALLNAAVFAIAWLRAWRALNLLGFAFTYGIGVAWGALRYEPALYASTAPFLALFFAFYLLIPILYARRRAPRRRDAIDGTLVFGNPLIAFSLYAGLVEGARWPLTLAALALVAVYGGLAFALLRREGWRVLGEAHAILAVGFATLAAPLALSARATASVFAVEGAALIWLGLRTQRRLPRWSGLALQGLAAFAFFSGWIVGIDAHAAIANPLFASAMLIALAGFAGAWLYWRRRDSDARFADAAMLLYGWGLLWWLGAGLQEIHRFVLPVHRADVALAFVAISGWLAVEIRARIAGRALAWTGAVAVAATLVFAVLQLQAHTHPFAGLGLYAWLLSLATGLRIAALVRDDAPVSMLVGAALLCVWPAANLLGFAYADAGMGALAAERYAPAAAVLALLFAAYLLLSVWLVRRRQDGDGARGIVHYGNPLLALVLYALMPESARTSAMLTVAALAAVCAAAAALLRTRALAVSLANLATGLAAAALAFALPASLTALLFALAGVALIAYGLRRPHPLARWGGQMLQLLAAAAFLVADLDRAAYAFATPAIAFVNPFFVCALVLALAGFAAAWLYWRRAVAGPACALYVWGLAWWTLAALHEIDRFLPEPQRADAVLAFVALTGWLAAEAWRRWRGALTAWTATAAFALALPLALLQDAAHAHPLAGLGGLAWLVWLLLGLRALACLREAAVPRVAAHAIWLWTWPIMLALSADALLQTAAQGWHLAGIALPLLAIAALVHLRPRWIAWPLQARFDAYRQPLLLSQLTVLGVGAALSLLAAGDAAPLPWIPLLNPLELAQAAVFALILGWLYATQRPLPRPTLVLVFVAGFAWLTAATLRGAHHLGDVPWSAQMFSTSLAQTCLSLVWSVLGVIGWILGSRRRSRMLWLASAVLMGVVLAKLVLIDRQHLGNLLGIASFIGYGLLCTVIGYFAPAPPRTSEESTR